MVDVFGIKDFAFPEGFLWGSATAAHQIEGNNIHSCNWYQEQERAKQEKDSGKVNPYFEPSGMACDHYNRYPEDVQLLSDLGHQVFRLGVEWARIEPQEGHFVEAEADHYVRELSLLKEKGIKTFVTLVHFSVPKWFGDKGAWKNLDNFRYFERYLKYILPRISPYVDFWNIFNEFNLGLSQQALVNKFNQVIFHARSYHLIKQFSDRPVSTAHALVQYCGKRQNDRFDRAMQEYKDVVNHEFFFHAIRTGELVVPGYKSIVDRQIKDTCDFWSINLYTREMVDARKADMSSKRYPFTKTRMLPMDFYLDEFYPECMYHNLTRLMDKPVYITENGCSCVDDNFRIVYLVEYLCALSEAIKAGVDVRGYLYWSLLDNYEWWSYIPKFGLVDVDRAHDFKRTPKPSAYLYKEIIENNGYRREMLDKYLKEMPRVREI
ncbi:MAG: glycoside hydrolase family 1 protein [Lachnospiraceae bacterium]|nr:glycoside hydrolase family 1 protein [Lachnospiraceae bacterium]